MKWFSLAILSFILLIAGLVITPVQASAITTPTDKIVTVGADIADNCAKPFFGLDPWYEYMGEELDSDPANKCSVKCFNLFPQRVANDCGKTRSDVPGIAAVIIDDLLRIAAMVAIAFILVGSFQYVSSRGDPDKTASARSYIFNALGGLGIALVAIAFVKFIGSKL